MDLLHIMERLLESEIIMIKLSQIQYFPNQVKYFLVEEKEHGYRVDCVSESKLSEKYNQIKDKDGLNFKIIDGSVHTANTVLTMSNMSGQLEDFCIELEENPLTVWAVLAKLKELEAEFVLDDIYIPITHARFSLSTPTISIGGYTSKGYRAVSFWSLDPIQAQPTSRFRFPLERLNDLADSGIMELGDVTLAQDSFYFDIPISRLPISRFVDEIMATFTICPAITCEHVFLYHLTQEILIGLECAFKLMSKRNGTLKEYKSSSGYYPDTKLYSKNLKIICDFSKPTIQRFNKVIFDKESDYHYQGLILAEDKLSYLSERVFKGSTPTFIKMFYDGFNLVYKKDPCASFEHEYFQYTAMARSLMFDQALRWFEQKIQILESNASSVSGTAYNVPEGTITFDYVITTRLGGNIFE